MYVIKELEYKKDTQIFDIYKNKSYCAILDSSLVDNKLYTHILTIRL